MIFYMTVIVRNRIFIISRCFSFLVYVLTTTAFIYFLYKDAILQPTIQNFNANSTIFFRYSYKSVLISIFVFHFYTLVTQIFLYRNFVRTRATEILFFATFLLGCLTESLRCFVPIQYLASNYSEMYILIGKGILFGRILAPLSLLFIALLSEVEQRSKEERNLILIIFTAMFFSFIIPINSTVITKYCTFKWGYSAFLEIFRNIVVFFACLSIFLKNSISFFDKTDSMSDSKKMSLGFLALSIGYLIACYVKNWEMLFIGTILLFIGTHFYLTNLHKKYMWV